MKLNKLVLLFSVFMLFYSNSSQAVSFEFEGINDRIETNILGYLDGKNYDCNALTTLVSQQQSNLIKNIRQAIQPFGYFNPIVSVSSSENNQCEPLLIRIELMEQTIITQSNIEIIGNDPDFTEIKTSIGDGLNEGSVLNQEIYKSLKKQLIQLANEKLYLDARFNSQKIDVFPENNTAHIELVYDLGTRYQVNQIKLNDEDWNTQLDPSFIEQLITLKPDQYVGYSELFKMKQKLNSYGYFDQVLIELDESKKSTGTVPLNISLSLASKYDYSVGIGYSTDAGVKSSFKYNNNRINNRGHQFNSSLGLSELSSEFNAVYKIPSAVKPASQWLNLQMAYKDEQTEQVSSQASKLGISQTRIQNNRWQNINFIDILHESFDTGIIENESVLMVPGMSWSLTNADSLPRPSRGFKVQAEIKGSSEDLWSDATFAQLTVQSKYIKSLTPLNRLLVRAQVGATASSDFDQLPTTYRFFAGGDQNIRGYDYESISPTNAAGDLAGGKHQFVGSIEFEHQFAPKWAAALFTDFGDAFTQSFDFKYSVGAGVRWFSPIGPVRVDVGVPINQDQHDFRLHITIGPDL